MNFAPENSVEFEFGGYLIFGTWWKFNSKFWMYGYKWCRDGWVWQGNSTCNLPSNGGLQLSRARKSHSSKIIANWSQNSTILGSFVHLQNSSLPPLKTHRQAFPGAPGWAFQNSMVSWRVYCSRYIASSNASSVTPQGPPKKYLFL